MYFALSIAAIAIVLLGVATLWRWSDHHADYVEKSRLIALQPDRPPQFKLSMIADLPEPAQRYFKFTIAPDTPLLTVANIRMSGQFSLGTKEVPRYMKMSADQTLASPYGFIWKMRAARRAVHLSGSDTGRWTRFWLMGLTPVARLDQSPDHARSAFGRAVAESVFWTPAALLPGPGVTWEPIDTDSARVIISHASFTQEVTITVDSAGRPIIIQFPRWSDANPQKIYQLQPFGGHLSKFKTYQGFTVPTRVEAGNHFGTDIYFPFFKIDVSSVVYPTVATQKKQ